MEPDGLLICVRAMAVCDIGGGARFVHYKLTMQF